MTRRPKSHSTTERSGRTELQSADLRHPPDPAQVRNSIIQFDDWWAQVRGRGVRVHHDRQHEAEAVTVWEILPTVVVHHLEVGLGGTPGR